MLSRYVVSQLKQNSYFLVGLGLGLWLALCVPLGEEGCAADAGAPDTEAPDEYVPVREERPLGPGGAPARALQRPRYYSTELGMRAPLLAAVLSEEDALDSRAAALNQTAARLQPALRFFMTARGLSALSAAPARPNVVGFTDTREMLKPFHALKYLADNYLDEYDFFFLVSDSTFVNARRLTELVSRLSVSQDVYMGMAAEDDSHYCTLEGGILLSNSVLRAVHGSLDWCVRNSYSPRHHENVGRCVLHAAHTRCLPGLMGEEYLSVVAPHSEGGAAGGVEDGGDGGASWAGVLSPRLAGAVTVQPVTEPKHFYMLHAYVSRVYLEQDCEETLRLRRSMVQLAARHPRGYRNTTWPPGLRADPGLPPPRPDTRFDHLRWTMFNATHALMPDEHRAAAPLSVAQARAVQLVLRRVSSWAQNRWSGSEARLLEAAWRWEPARALTYRLLLLTTAPGQPTVARQVEVSRPLGAARLVAAPYVTESVRVHMVLPVLTSTDARGADTLLRRLDTTWLKTNTNLHLIVVVGQPDPADPSSPPLFQSVRDTVRALADKYRDRVSPVELADPPGGQGDVPGGPGLAEGLRAAPRDALVLLITANVEFNDDFLNRVRMNTISGWQWYLPVGFSRYSVFRHRLFREPDGRRPAVHTGRFNPHHRDVLSFYKEDYEAALSSWRGAVSAGAAEVLAAAPLRCIAAPEPALVRPPVPAPPPHLPAGAGAGAGGGAEREEVFARLDLGARHSLAKLLLETQAEAA